jgi:hypothetical protein
MNNNNNNNKIIYIYTGENFENIFEMKLIMKLARTKKF